MSANEGYLGFQHSALVSFSCVTFPNFVNGSFSVLFFLSGVSTICLWKRVKSEAASEKGEA